MKCILILKAIIVSRFAVLTTKFPKKKIKLDQNKMKRAQKCYDDIKSKKTLKELNDFLVDSNIYFDKNLLSILENTLIFNNLKATLGTVYLQLTSSGVVGKVNVRIISKIDTVLLSETERLSDFFDQMSFIKFEYGSFMNIPAGSEISIFAVNHEFNYEIAQGLERDHIKKHLADKDNLLALMRRSEKLEQEE
jgi:hypothetical protein